MRGPIDMERKECESIWCPNYNFDFGFAMVKFEKKNYHRNTEAHRHGTEDM